MGLRERVGLLLLLVPGVLGAGIVGLFTVQHRQTEEAFLDRLRGQARLLAVCVGSQLDEGERRVLCEPMLAALSQEGELVALEVVDLETQEVVATWAREGVGVPEHEGRAAVAVPPGEVRVVEEGHPEDVLHGSGHVFVATAPVFRRTPAQGPGYVLRVRVTSRSYNERVIQGLLLVLLPALLVASGGGALAYFADRRLRLALRSLMAATGDIAAGDFDRRVAVATGDEMQELGEAVNHMAGALASQAARIEEHSLELERRLADRTLELEKARAIAVNQERVAATGLLAAGISHEIGNPLTAISAIVQRLRRSPKEPASSKLELLSENIARIQGIVRGLVGYSRPASDAWKSTSVNDVVRRTLSLVRLDPRARVVSFEAELDADVPRVDTIEDRLQQVLLNLLLNAIEAVHGSGTTVRVATAREGQAAVRIVVADDGPGVTQELAERIFDPFVTTRAGGSGLGLAISHGLVAELGGELSLSNATPRGARFEIRLPVTRGQSP